MEKSFNSIALSCGNSVLTDRHGKAVAVTRNCRVFLRGSGFQPWIDSAKVEPSKAHCDIWQNGSPKALKKFKRRVVTITGRSRGVSMQRRLGELRRYVRGWMGYFGAASQLKLFTRLDGWIRRRIRCCYWKQWKRPKTRRRHLITLGVPRRQAIRHARSRQGPWHMSKTIASGVGLTNAWLAEQGVLSLKSLWVELAHLR
jgi:hypothetical protein